MLTIYFIRHGETDWNSQGKLQGHTDVPLNEAGRAQAAAIAPLLKTISPDLIYSSDLQRALETARIACPDRSIKESSNLREIFLGAAEAKTVAEIQSLWGPLWESWSDWNFSSYTAKFPAGENKREALGRLFDVFSTHQSEWNQPLRLAFFTHGLILRTFAQWSANLQIRRFNTPNSCIYQWKWMPLKKLHFDAQPDERPRLQQIYLPPEENLELA